MIGRIVLVFGLWLSIIAPSMAAQINHPSAADLQVDPESLGSVVLGQKIKLMMHDGSYFEGKVRRAGRDEIVMHLNKSELKGNTVITRKGKEAFLRTSDIGIVYLRKGGSIAGPIMLGVLGGFLGAVGSAYVLRNSEATAAAFTIFVAGTAGGATGGALLGREAVKKTVTIYVTPENH